MDKFKNGKEMEQNVSGPEVSSEEELDPFRQRAYKLKFGCSLLCGFIALICGAALIFMSFQIQNVLMEGVVSQGQNSDQVLIYGIKVGALAAVLILMIVIQIVLKAVKILKE